jgi:adhesin transport system membrane fusion protein
MIGVDAFRRQLAVAHDIDRHPAWLGFSLVLLGLLVILMIWANFAILEEVTAGPAEIVPSGRVQVIQTLEGGILADLRVREGQTVARGEPLAVIDPTKANASFQEMNQRRRSLLAAVARLRAEATGRPLVFPAELNGDRDLIAQERATYVARRQAVDQSIAALGQSQALMRREMSITEPMAAKGLVPEVDAIRLRRQYNDAQMQIVERRNKYRSDASTELSKSEAELAQVSEIAAGRRDSVERTIVRAPVRGTVKNLRVTTIGGVVAPGGDIMEIVPLEDVLLVEAKIKPADVAFLRPGLRATVKLSAYNYLIYGSLKGTVELISPDTLLETRKPNEEAFYRVLIRTDKSVLAHNGKQLPIIPGMTASVEILTGHKTVWDYFLRPLLKIEEAFRER